MQRALNRYYRERLSHGRSAFARCVDAAALRLLIFAAAYIWFRGMSLTGYLSAFLSAIVVALASIAIKLIQELRFEKIIARERNIIACEEAKSRLAIMPAEQLLSAANRIIREDGENETVHIALIQRLSPVVADDVAKCYREARDEGLSEACMFSSSDIAPEAISFAERLPDISIRLYDAKALIERGGIAEEISDDEIDDIISQRMEKRRLRMRRFREGAFSRSRIKPYLILGGLFFLLSFVSDGGLYLRALASLSLAMAGITAFLERQRERSV